MLDISIFQLKFDKFEIVRNGAYLLITFILYNYPRLYIYRYLYHLCDTTTKKARLFGFHIYKLVLYLIK